MLVVIGIIWLIIIVIIVITMRHNLYENCITGDCRNLNGPGMAVCPGCEASNFTFTKLVLGILIYGIPSWILFLAAALIKDKTKKK